VAGVLALVLAVAGVLVLVLAVALIGPDKDRSRFDRIMSFAGLMLCRAPEHYVLPPATRDALARPDSCESSELPNSRSRAAVVR
jgi:hypothetical protein